MAPRQKTKTKVNLATARLHGTVWYREAQKREIPYFTSHTVDKIMVHNAPGEYRMSMIGTIMNDGKPSRGKVFPITGSMHGIACKDMSFLFGRDYPTPTEDMKVVESIAGEQVVRIIPAPQRVATVQLQGPVVLIEVPNAPSEFKLMMYDSILPTKSVNRMLFVRDLDIPERFRALRSEIDGKLPVQDSLNSFNFSKILQTALVFDEPLHKKPLVRVVYYDITKARTGEPVFPLYGDARKGISRQPTENAYFYEVDQRTGKRRDLQRY